LTLLYKSPLLTIILFIVIAAAVVGYAVLQQFVPEQIMHGGHLFEIIAIAGVFSIILLPNIIRMWYFTLLKPGVKAPVKSYITALQDLFVHMFTQKRALSCENNTFRWLEHFILVIGYLTLLFTTVFLNWFSTHSVVVIVLGYVVSAALFIITFDFVTNRIKKSREVSRFSGPSDWFFVIWLFLMGLSAFVVRLLIDLNLLETTFWVYLVHLIILAQWALVIVPFGKWTHFLYRSFAMYFEKIALSTRAAQ